MAADDGVLCHPEILTEEKLIDILSSRGIPKDELLSKDKSTLVQLFYRFIVPLPQRATNMRRANRLRKDMNPIINPVQSTNLKATNKKAGLKRKQPPAGMDEINRASKVTKSLHDTSVLSPTTECTKQITKLTVNCVAKKAAKPVKLSRNFLTKEHQTKLNSSSAKLNNLKNNIPRTPVLIKEKGPEVSTNSDSQVDSEEERNKSLKKFKRIAVTWP